MIEVISVFVQNRHICLGATSQGSSATTSTDTTQVALSKSARTFLVLHENRDHPGIGVWLAARRLNSGRFVWPKDAGATLTLKRDQFAALVLGLPWQRIGEAGIITVL